MIKSLQNFSSISLSNLQKCSLNLTLRLFDSVVFFNWPHIRFLWFLFLLLDFLAYLPSYLFAVSVVHSLLDNKLGRMLVFELNLNLNALNFDRLN